MPACPSPYTDDAEAERAGAIVATGIGGVTSLVRDAQAALTEGYNRVGPFSILNMIPDTAAGHVAIAANLRGPNYATVSACASSNHAIGEAAGIIRRGDADVMVAGGSEAAICEMVVAAFSAMRALSTKRNDDPQHASRPFDVDRDGFVIADGAGMIVLEDLEHAQRPRGRHPGRVRRLRRLGRRLPRHPARARGSGSGGQHADRAGRCRRSRPPS